LDNKIKKQENILEEIIKLEKEKDIKSNHFNQLYKSLNIDINNDNEKWGKNKNRKKVFFLFVVERRDSIYVRSLVDVAVTCVGDVIIVGGNPLMISPL